MRLIKAQSTNLRNIKGKGVRYETDNQIILDSSNVALVPKGTESERPQFPANGHIRYNTDINEFEFYANGAWRNVRYKEPVQIGIHQQNLGNGDASETIFGPLDSQDPNPDLKAPAAAENILVFVENVFQISDTNYTLIEDPSGFATGTYLEFTSPPDAGKPITVLHNFDK
jgi:hypothetical protein